MSAGILGAGGKIRNEALVAEGLPKLNEAMLVAKIDNPRRIAAFITTIAVESMFEYSISQIGATSTYRGRGYIQLTGSANYAEASLDLGVDLSNNPEFARSLEWSAKIATWYWTQARPKTNQYADALQMGMVNKMIGFPEGPSDLVRTKMFAEALRVLTGSVPPGITSVRKVPVFSTSEKLGQWSTAGQLVNNNIHNATEGGLQTLFAYSPSEWYVVADHSRADVRPGSVKSYPDTQRNFTDRPISSFKKILSSYNMTNPPVGEWNATYDIWIGGIGSKSTAEVMIWTDHRYPASIPPSNALETKKVTIDGLAYTAWRRKNGNGGDYIALVLDTKRAWGTVDLLKVFNWLVSVGWLKATDLVAAIEYGVEISNTPAGSPQVFRLNNYTLDVE